MKPLPFTLLVVLLAGAASVMAHEVFRVTGTVTGLKGTQLAVKTKEGRAMWIELTKRTIILRGKVKVPATELKPGLSVVLDVAADDDSDVVARQVRIMPASAPAKS